MMSLERNDEFKNVFLNTLTSYDQLSRLADIVSNCNGEDTVAGQLNTGMYYFYSVKSSASMDQVCEPYSPKYLHLQIVYVNTCIYQLLCCLVCF